MSPYVEWDKHGFSAEYEVPIGDLTEEVNTAIEDELKGLLMALGSTLQGRSRTCSKIHKECYYLYLATAFSEIYPRNEFYHSV